MGRLNKRDRGGGGRAFQCVRGNNKPNVTVAASKKPLFITRLVMFIFVEGLMLHVVCNPVLRCSKQRVKSFII